MWCEEETMDHLLLHCKFVHTLWSEVFYLFGVQGVMPKTVVSLLLHGGIGWAFILPMFEYGTGVSYVVNLEGTQSPNI